MRPLKLVVAIVAAILLLVIAAMVIVVATFDPNRYKPDLIRIVKERYDRTLAIEGELTLKFLPRIGASIGATRLSDVGGTKAFAQVSSMRVSVALLPLLSKRVVVDRVELVGLRADLVRRKDGSTNVDDLIGTKSKPPAAPANPSSSAASSVAIDIGGLMLRDAAIGWRDETAGHDLRVASLDLATGRVAEGASGRLTLSGRVTGVEPKLALQVELGSAYVLGLAASALRLSDIDLKLQGDTPWATGLSARAKGEVAADLRKPRFEVAGLDLAASAKDGSDAKLQAAKITFDRSGSESAPISGDLRLRRASDTLEAKLRVAAARSSGPIIDFPKVEVDFDSRRPDLHASGRLTTPVRVDLAKNDARLVKIEANLAVDSPSLPNRPLKIALDGAVDVALADRRMQADLGARFDETRARLKATVIERAKRTIEFDLAADRLNVDRYLPAKPAPSAGGSPAPSGGNSAERPIDLSLLKALDASGAVAIDALVAADVKLEQLRMQLKASGGQLEVQPITARLYQGTLSGSLAVNAHSNRFVIRDRLENVAVGPLLRDLADKDLLEGRGDVTIDVTTSGATASALKRALAGSAAFNLRDAALRGINLAEVFRKAQAVAAGRSLEAIGAAKTEKTDFSELTASFVIRNGVARNEDLAGKSPFLRLTGAGAIDIAAGTLDYTAKAQTTGSATGQGGREQEVRRGVTLPVRVTGPFSDLKYQVDVQDMAVEAVKDEAKKRLEDAIQKRLGDEPAGRAARDLLKGLFGR